MEVKWCRSGWIGCSRCRHWCQWRWFHYRWCMSYYRLSLCGHQLLYFGFIFWMNLGCIYKCGLKCFWIPSYSLLPSSYSDNRTYLCNDCEQLFILRWVGSFYTLHLFSWWLHHQLAVGIHGHMLYCQQASSSFLCFLNTWVLSVLRVTWGSHIFIFLLSSRVAEVIPVWLWGLLCSWGAC